MPKIITSPDCGNSPKNIFLQKLTIAFATGDTKLILNSVTDDIRWTIVGEKVIEGKEDFAKALKQQNQVAELTVQHVMTHGKAGAVNGTTKSKDGVTYAFCNVYEFGTAKGASVREITRYVIEI